MGLVLDHGSTVVDTNATTITIAPAATIVVGNHLLIGVGTGSASKTITVTDTQSNTYQIDRTNNATARASYAASAKITTQLTTSDTITVTYSASTGDRRLGVYEFSGLHATTWLDQVNSATGASTAPSSGNLVTTSANEVIFSVCQYGNGGASYTPGTGFTLLDDLIGGAGTQRFATAYRIVTSTGTYVADGTLGVSGNWAQTGATYIETAAPSNTSNFFQLF